MASISQLLSSAKHRGDGGTSLPVGVAQAQGGVSLQGLTHHSHPVWEPVQATRVEAESPVGHVPERRGEGENMHGQEQLHKALSLTSWSPARASWALGGGTEVSPRLCHQSQPQENCITRYNLDSFTIRGN